MIDFFVAWKCFHRIRWNIFRGHIFRKRECYCVAILKLATHLDTCVDPWMLLVDAWVRHMYPKIGFDEFLNIFIRHLISVSNYSSRLKHVTLTRQSLNDWFLCCLKMFSAKIFCRHMCRTHCLRELYKQDARNVFSWKRYQKHASDTCVRLTHVYDTCIRHMCNRSNE